ncbi:glutamate--tRNA ligase [Patescibacteria group bacterium]|nr:glutamate--tRNA ligase [Patescibacteria group bacterium]MBU4057508.1 glutamate--tRNA ligase [Patescibacteria group bacterium]MBU4116002.1 glutamate--tRNA ligase [Patescibacteria group bacterium]
MKNKNVKNNVVVRFAPSPTGYLHIGGARTALFNYIFARQNNGKLILRIEDTDRERSTKEYEKSIVDTMDWLELDYDEIYRQSERTEIYKKYLKKMIDDGSAYVSKEKPEKGGGRDEVIRFKNPNKKVIFNDLITGDIEVDTTDLGDFVIAKDLETPIFHLTNVIDDHEMGVTHIIRGQDHISNTPRQVLIQEAIGAQRPVYAHIPLILAPDKSKLSKRHGAVNVVEYKNSGYLSDAIINFLAFLGWNPGDEREILTREELLKEFKMEKVQKGGAVFNIEKLNWFNKKYIQMLSDKKFEEFVNEFMPEEIKKFPDYNKKINKIIPIIKERIEKFVDIKDMHERGELKYFFEQPEYEIKSLMWRDEKNIQDTKKHLEKTLNLLEKMQDNNFNSVSIKDAIWNYASEKGRGNVLWPMRYALSGLEKSPDPFILAVLLGKEETSNRIKTAIKKIDLME